MENSQDVIAEAKYEMLLAIKEGRAIVTRFCFIPTKQEMIAIEWVCK